MGPSVPPSRLGALPVGVTVALRRAAPAGRAARQERGSGAPKARPAARCRPGRQAPATLKAKGTLVVGVDATYAPNEFLGPDGQTVEGMDVDLFDAVAATSSA